MESEEAAPPYSVNMHQTDAVELVKLSAILLILNVPEGTLFGLNTQMFVVGPNFKGVKMVLPGPHFLYYSARSRHGGDSSPVTGFFIHVTPSQVVVRLWDVQEERLVKFKDSNEEERYALGAKKMEFDQQLAPYNLNHHKTWQLLSTFITPKVIDRIEPIGGNLSVMDEAALVEQGPKTPAEKRMYEHIAKGKEQLAKESSTISVAESNSTDSLENKTTSGRFFYTHLPNFVKKGGMTASELTALNMDKTQLLELVIEKTYGGKEDLLLGELQFCFIGFLMGQSLVSFGQWKTILSLLLRCEEAPLRTRTTFYVKFLRIVYIQLKQSLQPENKSSSSAGSMSFLDAGWLSEDNFFKLLLKDFFDMLRDATPVDGELLRQAKRLRKLLEETLGWIFEVNSVGGDEDDEYAPVVVY